RPPPHCCPASLHDALPISELPRECAEGDENQYALGSFEGLRNHMPELYRHEALLSARLRDGKIAQGRELSLEAFRNACRRAERADRKSTRLNSSHGSISYA